MGTYSSHYLDNVTREIPGSDPTKYEPITREEVNSIEEAIVKISGYNEDLLYGDPVKWYDEEKDMLNVSRQYPDLLFELRVETEGDERMHYYKNGKVGHIAPVITWPDFDESILE